MFLWARHWSQKPPVFFFWLVDNSGKLKVQHKNHQILELCGTSFHCSAIGVRNNIPLDYSVVCCLKSNLITWVQQMYHLHGLACESHCQALVESSHKKENNPDPLHSLGAQTIIKLFWWRLITPPPLPSVVYSSFLQASIFPLLLISSNIFRRAECRLVWVIKLNCLRGH